jgi:hypothetical protein
MRAVADKRGRGRKSSTVLVQAPVKGWNTLDSIAEMDNGYAVIMDNFIPTASTVDLRSGNVAHKTGIVGRVETLACYNNATSSKLFGAITDKIYDVTTAGAVGAAVVSGKSNGRWQHVNFATSGGQYLYMVNGQDSPMLYDGTTWTAITGASVPAITGVTTSTFINVAIHMKRVWFIQKDSMKAWYLPVDSIAGVANSLDFSNLFSRGGYLVAMGSWTVDSGTGIDDLAVFISSEGEVAVYRGTDPASATTWFLQGTYYIGSPLGYRCFVKFASDLLIINQDGFQAVSQALTSSRVTLTTQVTDKIQPSISEAITSYSLNYGWEAIISSAQNCILLNIPATGSSQQYVLNTQTKGWCRFTGWDAACFEVMGNELYFGTTDGVRKAFSGMSDNGTTISGKVLPAFSDMGTSALKEFVMARPIISTDSNSLGVLLGMNVDYDTAEPIGSPTFTTGTNATWDNALWDVGIWGGSLILKKDWQSVGNLGKTGAMFIKTGANGSQVKWSAVEYVFMTGSSYY